VRIETTRFGETDVADESLVQMPCGLPGFVHRRSFAVIPHPQGGPFQWLQSTEDPKLAFVIADPLCFRPDYHVAVPRSEIEELGLGDEADAQVWVICGIGPNPEDITANMAAPIIVNRRTRAGKQVLVQSDPEDIRFPIIRYLRQMAEGAPS